MAVWTGEGVLEMNFDELLRIRGRGIEIKIKDHVIVYIYIDKFNLFWMQICK